MQSSSSRVIIASAGSGKTTLLVEEALSRQDRRVAILTYTNNNIDEIKKKFCERHGVVPDCVDVMTWFAFLLHECARPYQRSVYSERRIRGIFYPEGRSAFCVKESNTARFYFKDGDEIYSDKLSKFVLAVQTKSGGLVTKRLAEIYHEIFIDEFQDFAGYDLDLIKEFLQVGIRMLIVGDPRQCTYITNQSSRNQQYRGVGILRLLSEWGKDALCDVKHRALSHRCNEQICYFADKLWPSMPTTESKNKEVTEHDGVFVLSRTHLEEYLERFNPVLLRYDKKAETWGHHALNFGNSKGLEFDRVLIVPHGPIKKYLASGDPKHVEGSREKFYVAVTRARHSVAFVYDGQCAVQCSEWKPEPYV